ncbi:MAG: TIGR04211 family SH3 domain-containing protein [Methylococcales bacterium]
MHVKKLISTFVMLMLFALSAQAKTVYVTDNLNLSLRSEENNQSKVIKMLATGTPLTVIQENKATGFSYLRTEGGTVGYMPTRNTMDEPPSRDQLETANKNLTAVQAENEKLKTELNKLKDSLTPGTSLEQSLANERDQLSRELIEIKQSSANVIQLKEQRDELQERVVNAERELEQFRLENQALEDSSNQDWFLYGGALTVIGMLLGFILPKISWGRRRSSGWDSF